MKIAVYGGAFNPVHLGHKQIVEQLQSNYNFDKILVIPSKISPHKSSKNLVSAEHRLNMCKLAFENINTCEICDIEIKNEGVSYTYKTLEMLEDTYKDAEFYLVCGSDMFLSLLNWKEYKKLFSYAKIIAFIRDNESISIINDYKERIEEYGAKVEICKAEILPYSSTLIRELIINNYNFEKYVSKEVYNYITEHNLYKN